MINKNASVYKGLSRTDMLQFIPTQYSKVLEIGCSDGCFRLLLKKDCEYWGVEPVVENANIASKVLDKVLVGFYDDVESHIPDGFFDLLILNDVLEHLIDPWLFLEAIKKKMTSDFYVVLSIPNVRFWKNLDGLLIKKDWFYRDSGILDITHLRFYTKKSIIRLLNGCGYEICHIKGINKSGLMTRAKKALIYLFCLMLGFDTRFLQFGILCKIKELKQSTPNPQKFSSTRVAPACVNSPLERGGRGADGVS